MQHRFCVDVRGDLPIIQLESNGYINVTQALSPYRGTEDPFGYWVLTRGSVLNDIIKVLGIPKDELILEINANPDIPYVAGTYVHPRIFEEIIRWLASPSTVPEKCRRKLF